MREELFKQKGRPAGGDIKGGVGIGDQDPTPVEAPKARKKAEADLAKVTKKDRLETVRTARRTLMKLAPLLATLRSDLASNPAVLGAAPAFAKDMPFYMNSGPKEPSR